MTALNELKPMTALKLLKEKQSFDLYDQTLQQINQLKQNELESVKLKMQYYDRIHTEIAASLKKTIFELKAIDFDCI